MTKKNFIVLAEWLKDEPGYCGFSDIQIEYLANFCHSQNPRFNRERWLGYIRGENGPNGGKVK